MFSVTWLSFSKFFWKLHSKTNEINNSLRWIYTKMEIFQGNFLGSVWHSDRHTTMLCLGVGSWLQKSFTFWINKFYFKQKINIDFTIFLCVSFSITNLTWQTRGVEYTFSIREIEYYIFFYNPYVFHNNDDG